MRPRTRQSGDTLIEVVISLAILAVTLVTSFDISNRSYSEGFQSREHTQAIYLAQEQAEDLYSYRNNLITTAVAAQQQTSVVAPPIMNPTNFDKCNAGCHFDSTLPAPQNTLPQTGPAAPVIFNGIKYYVVIGPLAGTAQALSVDNNEGLFTVRVSWSSSVGTGATAPSITGDTGSNENTTSLNVILIDNRGIAPRDCSVAGSSPCS